MKFTTGIDPWRMSWLNEKGWKDGVWSKFCCLWACFLQILSSITLRLNCPRPGDLKVCWILLDLKVWLQDDWNGVRNSSLLNFSSLNYTVVAIVSVW